MLAWTFTLGDLVNAAIVTATIFGAYYAIKGQLTLFKQTLDQHALTLSRHADRMDKYEGKILDLVADLNRYIGQTEGRQQM